MHNVCIGTYPVPHGIGLHGAERHRNPLLLNPPNPFSDDQQVPKTLSQCSNTLYGTLCIAPQISIVNHPTVLVPLEWPNA